MKRVIRNIIWGFIGILARLRLIGPVGIARLKYLEMMHRWPDFKQPRDINEKINWLKFNGDTSRWTELSDKYAVREYVAGKGLADTLVPLLGRWDAPKDIDWASLPDRFVMKPNNGSGDVLLCKDKSALDTTEACKYLRGLMEKPFGILSAEPHYALIKPCILAEEMLDPSTQPCGSSSMVDYKIWCFDGEPAYTMCCSNRTDNSLELSVYDLDWNYLPEATRITHHYKRPAEPIPRPSCYDKMLDVARKLSQGFPEVRTDLYEVDGKVFFGEMTFTSAGGFMNYYTDGFLRTLGDKVTLPTA